MIYLAAPYSNNPTVAFQECFTRVCELTKRGSHVFSPVIYFHGFAGTLAEGEIIQQCCNFVSRCQDFYILTLPGWEQSAGTYIEAQHWHGGIIGLYDGKHLSLLPKRHVLQILQLGQLPKASPTTETYQAPLMGPSSNSTNKQAARALHDASDSNVETSAKLSDGKSVGLQRA